MLIVIPVLALQRWHSMRVRRSELTRMGDKAMLRRLAPDVSQRRRAVRFWLMMCAVAMLLVALARPQMGLRTVEETKTGMEVMVALDISNSMMAQDVTPSRLEKSKLLIEDIITALDGDKVGLVVFAGEAFVQLPITNDYVSAHLFLDNATPDLIATQGTDIARAIEVCQNSFTRNGGVGHAIVVITDGEDHEGGAAEAAAEAAKKGTRIIMVGAGGTAGAPIPTPDGRQMLDRSGQVIRTALNENMCREIAKAGGGQYIHLDGSARASSQIADALSGMQRGEFGTVAYAEYAEQYQIFLILSIIFLIASVVVQERRNPRWDKIRLFNR